MAMFIQNNATGAGAGNVDPSQAAVDLGVIANGDTGLGLAAQVGNQQQVTYGPTLNGVPQNRLNTLVNTNFTPNYGGGAQAVNIMVIPVLANFVLNDGTALTNVAGTALPPQGSGLAGANLNTTNNCLVIYDTSQSNGNGYCTARAGTGGTLDLPMPSPVILYHELSHAFRIVNNNLLALTATCNPSSPEENAAIIDENDVRTQTANAEGTAVVLRDPGIHCGNPGPNCASCCIIASVASGSPLSQEAVTLRAVRDSFLRKTEVGFDFFQKLHHDYYSFSPQVCTMMARSDNLEPLVLNGFVRPLMIALRLLQGYALEDLTEEELGGRFAGFHPDPVEADEQLHILRRAHEYFTRTGDGGGISGVDSGIADLLEERAWSSTHIQWALIEPIRIYASALELFLSDAKPRKIGQALQSAFTAWAERIPLDQIWASLSARELRRELEMYEDRLLRTERARANFHERLREKFNHITSVMAVVGAKEEAMGGADGR